MRCREGGDADGTHPVVAAVRDEEADVREADAAYDGDDGEELAKRRRVAEHFLNKWMGSKRRRRRRGTREGVLSENLGSQTGSTFFPKVSNQTESGRLHTRAVPVTMYVNVEYVASILRKQTTRTVCRGSESRDSGHR